MSKLYTFGVLLAVLGACRPENAGEGDTGDWTSEVGLDIPLDREYRKPLLQEPLEEDEFGLGYEFAGPTSSTISSSTAVWSATRRWYEVSTEAGIAWSANSGLSWDEKYARWIDGLERAAAESGGDTVYLMTPWGKKLAAPKLECAETSMFLRATFAAWYNLPFFMTAYHPDIGAVHYGHFGIVTNSGARLSGSPTFGLTYKDYTSTWRTGQAWPQDTDLRGRYLTAAKDDKIGFLGGANDYAGAYFDEMHLNKRAGQFLLRLLVNFGSIHLVSPQNTFDVAPSAIREGDMLVERWQSQGIGHVMVVKEVDALPNNQLSAEIIFGSMPRIQPVWYTPAQSKSYFTSEYTGGAAQSSEGMSYAQLKGGLKRWRTPVEKSGKWVNIVPVKDRTAFIMDDDVAKIGARPAQFAQLLGGLSPEQERDALVAAIDQARANLVNRPASCSNRTRREDAFDQLYTLMSSKFGKDKKWVDEEYRELADYVYAELEYAQSKTCCWNSTTNAMHQIVMQYNEQLQADAEANNQCAVPVVFKAAGGGYEVFKAYAASIGRSADWKAWTEDEPCAQRAVSTDAEAASSATSWCSLDSSAPTTSDSQTGCGNIDWNGVCQDNTVVWCEGTSLQRNPCPSGTRCGWSNYYGYYWCL